MAVRWILSPTGYGLESFHDEFIVPRSARVELGGPSLLVDVDETIVQGHEAAAQRIAEQYVEALKEGPGLGLLRLMTLEEFGALPPFAGHQPMNGPLARQNARARREQEELIAAAVRRARNALLVGVAGTEMLRQAYDTLEDARTSEQPLIELYKAVESVENALGGASAVRALLPTLFNELKAVKRLANQADRDERHAPKPGQRVQPATAAQISAAHDSARRVIHAYGRSF